MFTVDFSNEVASMLELGCRILKDPAKLFTVNRKSNTIQLKLCTIGGKGGQSDANRGRALCVAAQSRRLHRWGVARGGVEGHGEYVPGLGPVQRAVPGWAVGVGERVRRG